MPGNATNRIAGHYKRASRRARKLRSASCLQTTTTARTHASVATPRDLICTELACNENAGQKENRREEQCMTGIVLLYSRH
eukprot:3862267-Rhodomonas_salina.1